MGSRDAREVRIGSRQLRLVNLDKVLYPQAGFTKAQVIDYYVRISGALLPHLRDRPLTLKRYPNGVTQPYFYEKRCPSHRPEWVRTAEADGIRFCLMNDLASLVWAANLADLELHVPLARARIHPGHRGGSRGVREGSRLHLAHLRIGGRHPPRRGARRSLQASARTEAEAATPFAGAMKERGEQHSPRARENYGTAAPVPRRRTAKIKLMTARINRMWTHAPICAPDTRPSTQSTSRMTVMVQSISRLLSQQR